MRILLATGAPTLPQMIGGSQRSGDALIRALQARGYTVGITAGLVGEGRLGWRGKILMKLSQHQAILDNDLGYPAYRSWYPVETAGEVFSRFRPDIVIVLAHSTGLVANAFHKIGANLLFSFQDVEFDQHGYDLAKLKPIIGVANSQFTADAYSAKFDASCTVIHPLIEFENYLTPAIGGAVTFINPSPLKGLTTAIETARLLPNIPFRFQETWPMGNAERTELLGRLADLSNVTLAPPVEDMREIYSKTRILFCPSQWNEGYGRIASEAQISGIPVVGSDRGGLPEAIGNGGTIVCAEAEAKAWANAIVNLWSNPTEYEAAARAAIKHANRPELQFEKQVDRWEHAISLAHMHNTVSSENAQHAKDNISTVLKPSRESYP